MFVIPVFWKGEAGGPPEVRSLRPAWPTTSLPKNTKISWVWWHTPIIPATPEAEAGELLEPGRQGLQWVEIVCHCTPTWQTEWDSVSKKKKRKWMKRKEQKRKEGEGEEEGWRRGGGSPTTWWGQHLQSLEMRECDPLKDIKFNVSGAKHSRQEGATVDQREALGSS